MRQMRTVTFEELPKATAGPLDLLGSPIDGYQAVYNPEDMHIFCIPTSEYQLVTHQQMIEKAEESLVPLVKIMGDYERIIRIDGFGERMRTTYRFPSTEVEVKKGDLINPTVELFNSLDRSWKNSITVGIFRLICTNGAMIGESYGKFKKRHIRSLDLSEAQTVLEDGLAKVQQVAIEWKGWAETPVEKKEVDTAVAKLNLTNKEKTLLLEEQEVSTQLSIEDWLLFQELNMRPDKVAQMNKWVLFNAFTQFATHQVTTELRRLQIQNAITDYFFN